MISSGPEEDVSFRSTALARRQGLFWSRPPVAGLVARTPSIGARNRGRHSLAAWLISVKLQGCGLE